MVVKRQSWYVTWIRRPRRPPVARRLCPLAPPVVSTTPPHPEASPDRPGAVTLSRIVARNPGHPEPYTGTRTVLVCSSRPRGPGAAAAGGTSPRNPPLRWRGPRGTRNTPDNFGSAAGGFTQAPGGWAGPKLERVEFPAGGENSLALHYRDYLYPTEALRVCVRAPTYVVCHRTYSCCP